MSKWKIFVRKAWSFVQKNGTRVLTTLLFAAVAVIPLFTPAAATHCTQTMCETVRNIGCKSDETCIRVEDKTMCCKEHGNCVADIIQSTLGACVNQ